MYLKEALQIWYCLFYKLLNAQNFKILNLSLVKKYMIIKIEKIMKFAKSKGHNSA